MELLRYYTNADFGTDVVGQSGIIINGIWGHEGKVLLMIDGIPMNEFIYGNTEFGYHYPLGNVLEIEIIRGSGSVLFGTFAELMVINIITREAREINGLEFYSDFGLNSHKLPFYQNYTLSAGRSFHNNLALSTSIRISEGYRSTFNYKDIYDNYFNLLQNRLNDAFGSLKIKYKNLSIVTLFDNYTTTSRDYFIRVTSRPYPKNFFTVASKASYNSFISKKLRANFSLVQKFGMPWVSPQQGNASDTLYYSLIPQISTLYPKAEVTYYFNNKFRLTFGSSVLYNYAIDKSPKPNLFWNGTEHASLISYAQYSEINFLGNHSATFSIGERAEYNPIYGFSFLPRLGFSKKYSDKVILKFSYDKSFRPPTVANISYNMPLYLLGDYSLIKPEITQYFNSELTMLFKKFAFTFNTFYLNTKDAITYFLDSKGNEGYANVSDLSTSGLRLNVKYLSTKLFLWASLCYQRALTFDTLALYYVTPNDYTYLGTSEIKFSLHTGYKINRTLTFNTNLIVLSPKKGYFDYDSQTNSLIAKTFPVTTILSPNLSFSSKKISLDLTIYNLLNQKDYLIQPYRGWHAPLVNKGRVIYFSLRYKFNY